MNGLRELGSKLRAWVSLSPSPAREIEAEIEAHLALAVEANLQSGMPLAEAQAAARRRFGNLLLTRERAREQWGFPALDALARDLRHGLRGLGRSPSFTLTVVLTLALGMGATTAIFSVVDQVLLRPLDYPAADRLVWIEEASSHTEGMSVTWLNFQAWLHANRTFEDLAGFNTVHRTLTGRGDAELLRFGQVTNHFPRLVGMRAVRGRLFSEADDRPGAPATVVLNSRFWAEHLGSDPNVIGTSLMLDGKPCQILGIASPVDFFSQPVAGYLPLGQSLVAPLRREQHGSMRVLGRLRLGGQLAAARTDLDRVLQHLAEVDPGPESDHRAAARFLATVQTHEVRTTLVLLLSAVGLVLLIACANVASLMLARSTVRSGEIAVRMAIGAGSRRIGRQLLTESLLLSSLGGVAGIAMAYGCLRALLGLAPAGIPRLTQTTLNVRVLLFVGIVTALTGVLVALAPVAAARRVNLASALQAASRSVDQSRRGLTLRNVLVTGEIALTMVLAFGAGLLLRSLTVAQNSNPGFRPDHVLALELALPASTSSSEDARRFFSELIQRLRRLPGVTAVGAVDCPPAAADCNDWFFSVPGQPAPPDKDSSAALFSTADSDYFRTLQIPMVEGRAFRETDRPGSPAVAIVDATLARRIFPGRSAVGQQLKLGPAGDPGVLVSIVGVSGDVSQDGLDGAPQQQIFRPFSQQPSRAMVLMIRARVPPSSLKPAVRRQVAEVDRSVPIQSLSALPEQLGATLAGRRFGTALLVAFAVLALLLAAVGIFGLLDYWVRSTEREIAVRAALGAPRSVLVRGVAGRLLPLVGAGATCGAAGAAGSSRWLASLVFGVSPTDPATLVGAVLAVLAIAFVGAAAPAWHAAHVDPQRKLQGG